MDTRRLVLFVIFSMSILMLWDAWQRQHGPVDVIQQVAATNPSAANASSVSQAAVAVDSDYKLQVGQRISVTTDLYKADIETTGGDLRRLELLKQRAADNDKTNYILLGEVDAGGKPMTYVAQTGLLGADLPTHKSLFTSAATHYEMQEGQDALEVRLSSISNGVAVDKVYTFHRNKYVMDVNYEIKNGSPSAITPTVYYQIVHDDESNQGSKMMPSFTGGSYFTETTKFKKLAFSDMAKEPLKVTSTDGWVGLLQHYFVSAWVPKDGLAREFYTEKLNEHMYRIGTKSTLNTIAPGANLTVPARLFSGPQTKHDLSETAPGLEYTVDYGWLTVVAAPLFWTLSKIYSLVNNWGVAIILLTLLIKAAFYPLSAKSYRSMAQMRELAPRLEVLKKKFGDDRQKMQMAMMDIYKTEKINPMSGCLPILIQIPVFISLYWMLLGSVELRHAPFFGWIQDLSAVDPYYILPIIMGLSMIIQTKLNPKPTDPIQAKVMTWMPVIFSVFFFFFPAGLVLYWVINNIISIWQQWYVNKTIHAAALLKKSGGKH
ncbi:MAG: membrane protein insertase YidC [Methylotenera sp.]|nr:membrane protein insertase YidC [Methylotenera sp.]MSP99746.1 membrane protein insertase YidC [Methylotenera sp.]